MIPNHWSRKYFLAVGTLYLLLFGCAQRYNNIPRVHVSPQNKTYRSTGHYVPKSAKVTQKTHTTSMDTVSSNLVGRSTDNKLAIEESSINYTLQNKTKVKVPIDSSGTSDSTTNKEVDKSLIKNSTGLFVVAAGMNAAFLLTPTYNFMFIGLLIGLGLLVLGYFVSKFIGNANDNRILPIKYRSRLGRNRSQLKKAFNICMIISGSSFVLALFTAATGSFSLPFFFFVLGMITLYGGLLVGLIYVIVGA